jgi:hypothetical protein
MCGSKMLAGASGASTSSVSAMSRAPSVSGRAPANCCQHRRRSSGDATPPPHKRVECARGGGLGGVVTVPGTPDRFTPGPRPMRRPGRQRVDQGATQHPWHMAPGMFDECTNPLDVVRAAGQGEERAEPGDRERVGLDLAERREPLTLPRSGEGHGGGDHGHGDRRFLCDPRSHTVRQFEGCVTRRMKHRRAHPRGQAQGSRSSGGLQGRREVPGPASAASHAARDTRPAPGGATW